MGYYPQYINFWSDGCGKKWNAGFRCQDCHYQKYKVLTIDSIMSHLKGNEVIGVYPLHKDNTCRFLVFDFDNHDKDAGNDFANIDESWKEEVNAMRTICQMNGIDPLIERSRSGKERIFGFSLINRFQLFWQEILGMLCWIKGQNK